MIKELSKKEFDATCTNSMRLIEPGDTSITPVNIDDYVEECLSTISIEPDTQSIEIHYVYMNDQKGICHVGINLGPQNLFLVVITKPETGEIMGHSFLNLSK